MKLISTHWYKHLTVRTHIHIFVCAWKMKVNCLLYMSRYILYYQTGTLYSGFSVLIDQQTRHELFLRVDCNSQWLCSVFVTLLNDLLSTFCVGWRETLLFLSKIQNISCCSVNAANWTQGDILKDERNPELVFECLSEWMETFSQKKKWKTVKTWNMLPVLHVTCFIHWKS